MDFPILCIGSASRDIFFLMEDVKILNTPEDLTAQKHMMLELGAKYRTEDRYEAIGGCSLNVSIALARLGVSSASYSLVGDDTYGEGIIEELMREGVNTDSVARGSGMGTDVSCILVDGKSADRTIIYNRDTNEQMRVTEATLPPANDIFVSGLYGEWKGDLAIIEKVAKEKSIRVYYNPGQGNISENVQAVIRMISVSEMVFLNKDEAIELVLKGVSEKDVARIQDEKYLAMKIFELGARRVIITDGGRGAWAYRGEDCYRAKVKPIEHIVDSTGSGDAFTGAFIAAHLRKKDMAECMRWGVANGGSVVQHFGAKEGLLTLPEIIAGSEEIEVVVV